MQIISIKKNRINVILFLILFQSCSSDSFADIQKPIPTEISYEVDIKPIIESRCISCHALNNPTSGYSIANYNQVKAKTELTTTNGLLHRIQLNEGDFLLMPQGGPKLIETNIQKFSLWKEQAYKQ